MLNLATFIHSKARNQIFWDHLNNSNQRGENLLDIDPANFLSNISRSVQKHLCITQGKRVWPCHRAPPICSRPSSYILPMPGWYIFESGTPPTPQRTPSGCHIDELVTSVCPFLACECIYCAKVFTQALKSDPEALLSSLKVRYRSVNTECLPTY